jgi:5-dehydro-2-deoxygluconokinase
VIEAFVMGQVGIDLYPNQLRTPLRDVRTYTRFVGGFAGNVSTGLARLGETTLEATGTHRGTTIFDLDWRPALWERADEYPALAAEAVSSADILIGNEEEVAAAELEDVPVFVIKRGEHGATVHEHGKATDVPRSPVDVINGLGAGDAFAAAVGHGLLRGHSLVEAVRRGTVAGALVAVQLACSEAMPRLGELEAALA